MIWGNEAEQCFALDGHSRAEILLCEDKKFASLELSRRNKGVLPYFLYQKATKTWNPLGVSQ